MSKERNVTITVDLEKVMSLCTSRKKRTIKKGLTLEEAQAHCQDPETSSRTCTEYANVKRTKEKGMWFDGY
jgi:hypothetical protein